MNGKGRLRITQSSRERRHAEMRSLMEHHFLLFLSFLFLLLVPKLPQSCGPQVPSIKQFLSVAASESSWGFFPLAWAGPWCLFVACSVLSASPWWNGSASFLTVLCVCSYADLLDSWELNAVSYSSSFQSFCYQTLSIYYWRLFVQSVQNHFDSDFFGCCMYLLDPAVHVCSVHNAHAAQL